MPKLKHTKVVRGGQTASPSGWKEVQNLKNIMVCLKKLSN